MRNIFNLAFSKRAMSLTLALILCCCFCFVGCEEEEKRDFPPKSNVGDSVNAGANGNSNSGNTNTSSKKRVAITYDDGPHNVRTAKIVDELDKYGYNATFFVVGNRVDGKAYDGSKAMKYAYDKGNEIAIHGYTHSYYYDKCDNDIYRSELSDTRDAILSVAPKAKIKLMRPIGGRITDARVSSCQYSVIMWSVDSQDWKYKDTVEGNVDVIVENVMSQVKNGSIILMHDIYDNTYEATKIILARLHDEGYDVVTVSELLGNPKAGVKYSKAN